MREGRHGPLVAGSSLGAGKFAPRIKQIRRYLAGLPTAVLVVLAIGASVAFASGFEEYGGGPNHYNPSNGVTTSASHYITEDDVQVFDSSYDCANYINVGGGSGTGLCTQSYTTHPYCGCVNRWGWAYNYYRYEQLYYGDAWW